MVEGHFFSAKSWRGTTFSSSGLGRKQMITIEAFMSTFGSQTVQKCSKIVQTSCLRLL
jgi:hypothetical protein